jgi:hypothetical protein
VLRTGHATALFLQAFGSLRTITCGMLAIKPSNKPLHLTAARSVAGGLAASRAADCVRCALGKRGLADR